MEVKVKKNLFSELLWSDNHQIKSVGYAKKFDKMFAGSHSQYTDKDLVNWTVLELATLPTVSLHQARILVVLDPVFLDCLISQYDVDPAHVAFYSDNRVKTIHARSLGVTKIFEGGADDVNKFKEIEMKFDVVVGNPPFSKANAGKTEKTSNKPKLYPEFYKKATEMASVVAMVMPDTSKATVALKKHNTYITKTSYHIANVSQEQQTEMGVQQKMWVVFFDKNQKANVSDKFLEVHVNNTIPFQKGKGGTKYTTPTTVTTNMVRAVMAKTGADIIQVGEVKPSSIVNSPYAVVIGIRLNGNGFNTDIIQPNGCSISGNVYYIECETLEEAKAYKAIVDSSSFYTPLLAVRGNNNTISLSKLKSAVVV